MVGIEDMDSRKIEQVELTKDNFQEVAAKSVGGYKARDLWIMLNDANKRNETWMIRVWGEW